jgi:Tol biopolymer transport system component
MRHDGSMQQNLTHSDGPDDHGAWAPDGQSIAFVSLRDGGFDIYRMALPAMRGDNGGGPARPMANDQ